MKPTKLKLKKKLTSTMIYHAKKYLFFSLFIIFSTSIAAQNFEWDGSYGGSNKDVAHSIQNTDDGGYIVAGETESDDGDVSGNNDFRDLWILKLDGLGNIQWEVNYGGSGSEVANSVQQTADGGFIVAGFARSSDGDVSGNNGLSDYWVLKLDGSGNIEWEKNYGGSSVDEAQSILATDDGGYFVAGNSESDDGDVSDNNGLDDYWVLKLDGSGNIEWEENYGGSLSEKAYSTQTTDDGGYIVAGESKSDNGDVSGNNGSDDYWLVKLDTSGNIQWETNYGGSFNDEAYSVQQNPNGGYIVAGRSNSDDGDVSGNYDFHDYWILKLDGSGNIEWEQNYGGNGNDGAKTIATSDDGGYIVTGYSGSQDGDISSGNNWGAWLLKLNSLGNIEWENNILVNDNENVNAKVNSIKKTEDGGYILAGQESFSSNNNGFIDFWIVKLSGSNMGISGYDKLHNINIYPNPTSGKINIQMDDIQTDKLEIKLSNISGQVVLRQTKDFATNFAIDFNGSAGIYFLEITTDNDKKFMQRIVKN